MLVSAGVYVEEEYVSLESWWLSYSELLKQVLLTLFAFVCLERFIPIQRSHSINALIFNVSYKILNLGLVLCLIPSFALIAQKIKVMLHAGYIRWPAPGSLDLFQTILWCLAYAFIWDLLQYAGHRMQHSIPFLFEIHKFHHAERALNASSTGRKHILEHIFEEFTIVLPLILIFSDPVLPVIVQSLFFNGWGYFNHMNARIDLGPLTSIVSGPQFHRIHHSIDSKHYNKNFAAFFPFIDQIFGTYYKPSAEEYPDTGLEDRDDVHNLLFVYVEPLKNWSSAIIKLLSNSWRTHSEPT